MLVQEMMMWSTHLNYKQITKLVIQILDIARQKEGR